MMGKPQASDNLEKLYNAARKAWEVKAQNLTWYAGLTAMLNLIYVIPRDKSYMPIGMGWLPSVYGIPSSFDDTLGINIVELRGDNFSATIELEPMPPIPKKTPHVLS
jgi:hypothetical protein